MGTGDRSEKIKTYNYKDSRVSDHRLKMNFDLDKCPEGEPEFEFELCRMCFPSLNSNAKCGACMLACLAAAL